MAKDLQEHAQGFIHFEKFWCFRRNVHSLAGCQSPAQHLPLAWRSLVWCAMHGCMVAAPWRYAAAAPHVLGAGRAQCCCIWLRHR